MTHFDDSPLADLEAQMARSDPRFAHGMGSGRPHKPREYRHRGAWLMLAVSVVLLVTGLFLPQGLLIAAGLVLAGISAQYLGRHSRHPRRRPRLP
ncbi:DUF3040 domain-containing protein [Streptomyces sp. NPDC046977]|uniref:DUF3040 domain-containing protein n=1 Tax=Streptomyces sp. NPDC046977 TaxID=3154703 RepID=UPI0033ECBEB1